MRVKRKERRRVVGGISNNMACVGGVRGYGTKSRGGNGMVGEKERREEERNFGSVS